MAVRRLFLCHGLPVTEDSRRLNFYEVTMEPHAQTSTRGCPCLSGTSLETSAELVVLPAAGQPPVYLLSPLMYVSPLHTLNELSTAWRYHQENYTYLNPIYWPKFFDVNVYINSIVHYNTRLIRWFFFSYDARAASGPGPPYCWGFTITLIHTTVGMTPLNGWSARRRDLYLTTQKHSQETDIHASVGIRTRISSKRTAADPLHRSRGHWDQHAIGDAATNLFIILTNKLTINTYSNTYFQEFQNFEF